MDRPTAILNIRERANQIATTITAIHPLIPALAEGATQSELFRALFEMTKQVEVVKKHLLRLEKGDASTDL